MAALHELTHITDEDEEDELTEYTCPECGTDRFIRRTWGTYWENHTVRLNDTGRVVAEDWDNVDHQQDDGDPWTCIHHHTLPDNLQDYLYETT